MGLAEQTHDVACDGGSGIGREGWVTFEFEMVADTVSVKEDDVFTAEG